MHVYEEDVVRRPHCSHSEHKYGLIEKRSTRPDISGNFVSKYDFKIKKKDFFFLPDII